MTTANANNVHIAGLLSDIDNSKNGTLVCLTIRKRGVIRGNKPNKKKYNNDMVKVLLWTGMGYKALAERSLKKLTSIWDQSDHFIMETAATIQKTYPKVTIQDVAEAASEINHSLHDEDVVEEEDRDPLQDAIREKVWETLEVNGVKVKGAKVYRGEANPSDPRVPVPGTIYMTGIKLGEVLLESAPHYEIKHFVKTAVKESIRKQLPISLYRQYCLGADSYRSMTVGPTASIDAKTAGLNVNRAHIKAMFKV